MNWQDWETAPKGVPNGFKILAYGEDNENETVGPFRIANWCACGGLNGTPPEGHWNGIGGMRPTHWALLETPVRAQSE